MSSRHYLNVAVGVLIQELIAVSAERVARLDLSTGQCLQAWSYDMMTSWSVNWTNEQVKVRITYLTAAIGVKCDFFGAREQS